ncbi:MAG: hypothetical protein U1E70_04175 [Acetobacteraceae bacterium]
MDRIEALGTMDGWNRPTWLDWRSLKEAGVALHPLRPRRRTTDPPPASGQRHDMPLNDLRQIISAND